MSLWRYLYPGSAESWLPQWFTEGGTWACQTPAVNAIIKCSMYSWISLFIPQWGRSQVKIHSGRRRILRQQKSESLLLWSLVEFDVLFGSPLATNWLATNLYKHGVDQNPHKLSHSKKIQDISKEDKIRNDWHHNNRPSTNQEPQDEPIASQTVIS